MPLSAAFCRARFRESRELALQVRGGNAIPETVFEREHLNLFLLDAEDRRVRQADRDFVRAQINRHVLLQIEAGFRCEGRRGA